MNRTQKRKVIYIFSFIAVLLMNIIPILIFWEDVAINKYSMISIAFAVYSVVYVLIAFNLKNKGNLFIVGKYWFYNMLSWSFLKDQSYTKSEEYKKEFELSAFIYCAIIPAYITIALFANDFYSTLSQALGWTIVRMLAIIIIVIIPPIIKRQKEKKLQQIKDEADRKEQERRESMGKWK